MASTVIDGSVLEGGGQILRNTVSLSALLRKPVSIHNVRHNRPKPGLRNQHATGIALAAEICSASTTGVAAGSTAIEFHPGHIVLPRNFTADSITAGSTTLLLQVALPCLLFASTPTLPSTLTLHGGTNASFAPQIDYTQHVLFPFLRHHFALDLSLSIAQRGYQRGGGRVHCAVTPVHAPLRALTLTARGALTTVCGLAQVGGLPTALAREMAAGAADALVAGGVARAQVNVGATREPDRAGLGGGSGIVLWAETDGGCVLGASALGAKGQEPRAVGAQAAEDLLRVLRGGACVDEYLQDQIIIFLALAAGRSSVRTGPLELHTKTAIWVAEQMTSAKFEVEEEESGECIIHCEGIGYTA